MSESEIKYNDYPWDEIVKAVNQHIANGATIYQKFSCEKCGQRLTMDVPNILFYEGTCDRCGHTTDIRKRGCNYLLEWTF
jgi:hypothetical protein